MNERAHRIIILVIAGGILGGLMWGGMKFFESRSTPSVIPSRSPVRFEPKTEAWQNAQFEGLRPFMMGEIEVGALGKPFPFGDGSGLQLLAGQVSPLASMEEIPLGGARAIDVARSSDGAMLVLLNGGGSYEIRSYAANGTATTFAAWTSKPGEPAATRLTSSGNGSVWLGGTSGRIARCMKNGAPEWLDAGATGLSGTVSNIVVDGTGRVWATDGIALSLGGEDSFAPFDYLLRIRDEDRSRLISAMGALPNELRPAPLPGENGLLRAALAPKRLETLANGEIGLVSSYAAVVFPLALQNRIRMLGTDASLFIPLAFTPQGGLFGRDVPSGELAYADATGTSIFASKAVPKDARYVSGLFASDGARMYALDYTPTSTVLWTRADTEWTAEIVAASGTAPLDRAIRIGADGNGSIWALLSQGGLLHIRKGAGR